MMKMAPSSLVCILSWMFSPDRRTGTIYSWPPSPRATLLARNQGKGPRLPFEVLSQRKLSLLQPVLRRQGHLIEKLFARNCSRWLGQHIITYRHHNYTQPIHPKSKSPGCPDSANYLNFPQNYSLRTQKLPTLLCWILSRRTKVFKMCKSVVKKCHKCIIWVKKHTSWFVFTFLLDTFLRFTHFFCNIFETLF